MNDLFTVPLIVTMPTSFIQNEVKREGIYLQHQALGPQLIHQQHHQLPQQATQHQLINFPHPGMIVNLKKEQFDAYEKLPDGQSQHNQQQQQQHVLQIQQQAQMVGLQQHLSVQMQSQLATQQQHPQQQQQQQQSQQQTPQEQQPSSSVSVGADDESVTGGTTTPTTTITTTTSTGATAGTGTTATGKKKKKGKANRNIVIPQLPEGFIIKVKEEYTENYVRTVTKIPEVWWNQVCVEMCLSDVKLQFSPFLPHTHMPCPPFFSAATLGCLIAGTVHPNGEVARQEGTEVPRLQRGQRAPVRCVREVL